MKIRLCAGLAVAVFSATILNTSANAGPGKGAELDSRPVSNELVIKIRKAKTASLKRPAAKSSHVESIIKMMAPKYGVPTWFALRIAKVESGYNPNIRGAAGEYGVYQMKCATAKGIGFSGNCSKLLNASTNVEYGLKHLALAMKLSKGNLKLAASKHNGGLGRKRLVNHYVGLVF